MKDSEKELIKMLAEFPAVIDKAAEELKPSLIAHLLIDISQKFTAFYHECPILNEDVELMKARLLLAECVRQVLETGLGLLGIDAPEEM